MSPGRGSAQGHGARPGLACCFWERGARGEALPAWRERGVCSLSFVKLSRDAWDAAGRGSRRVGEQGLESDTGGTSALLGETRNLFPARTRAQPAGLAARPAAEVWDVFFSQIQGVFRESLASARDLHSSSTTVRSLGFLLRGTHPSQHPSFVQFLILDKARLSFIVYVVKCSSCS